MDEWQMLPSNNAFVIGVVLLLIVLGIIILAVAIWNSNNNSNNDSTNTEDPPNNNGNDNGVATSGGTNPRSSDSYRSEKILDRMRNYKSESVECHHESSYGNNSIISNDSDTLLATKTDQSKTPVISGISDPSTKGESSLNITSSGSEKEENISFDLNGEEPSLKKTEVVTVSEISGSSIDEGSVTNPANVSSDFSSGKSPSVPPKPVSGRRRTLTSLQR